MGNIESNSFKLDKIHRNSFDFKYVIGKGGFGKVWKVTFKKTNVYYALKEMSKVKIIDRKSEKSIICEKNLLQTIHHPFIVNMIYTFQDYDYLYLVMDLLQGGDLRYHLCKYRHFNEEQTKFFIANIILALEYLHNIKKIIHRDIKPENLVSDENGYIRLTDFGVAKKYKKHNSEETSGTPGYMAPEVLCGQNHSFYVDYFSLGIICYEFMLGVRPYLGKNRKEIKQAVLSKQVQIKGHEIPIGWSYEAADFINKLIQRKVSNRLGYNGGIEEIKNHSWFNEFDWEKVFNKQMTCPFVPIKGDNFDKKYCGRDDKIGNDTFERYQIYRESTEYSSLFMNYTVNNIPKEEITKYINNNINNSNHTTTQSSKNKNVNLINKNNVNKKKINNFAKLKLNLNNNNKLRLKIGNLFYKKNDFHFNINNNNFHHNSTNNIFYLNNNNNRNKNFFIFNSNLNGFFSPIKNLKNFSIINNENKNLKIKNKILPNIDLNNNKLKKSKSNISLINNNFLSNRNKFDYNFLIDKKRYFFRKTGYFSPQNISINLFQNNNNINYNISQKKLKSSVSTINFKKKST